MVKSKVLVAIGKVVEVRAALKVAIALGASHTNFPLKAGYLSIIKASTSLEPAKTAQHPR